MKKMTKLMFARGRNNRKGNLNGGEYTIDGNYRIDGDYMRANDPMRGEDLPYRRGGDYRNDGEYDRYEMKRRYEPRYQSGHYPEIDDRRRNGEYSANRRYGDAAAFMGFHDSSAGQKQIRGRMMHDDDDEMEFNEDTAEEWVESMQNEDGTKGPHWSLPQIKQVMMQVGASSLEPYKFYAVMNSLYSDYAKVAKKHGMDKPDFYGDLTKAWLEDKDSVKDKVAAYYQYVVKH